METGTMRLAPAGGPGTAFHRSTKTWQPLFDIRRRLSDIYVSCARNKHSSRTDPICVGFERLQGPQGIRGHNHAKRGVRNKLYGLATYSCKDGLVGAIHLPHFCGVLCIVSHECRRKRTKPQPAMPSMPTTTRRPRQRPWWRYVQVQCALDSR